jgi:hypothetical protein
MLKLRIGSTKIKSLEKLLNAKCEERCFMIWPREGKRIEAMIDSGFFITNPNSEAESPPASMYWEPEEYRTYKEKHPDTKPWTLVEAEGNWYIMEGWHYVNRLAYLIEA